MQLDRAGFRGGLGGAQLLSVGIDPMHNYMLAIARNGLVGQSGGFWKRKGTTLSIESPAELRLARYQYSGSYCCQMVIHEGGVWACEHSLGRIRKIEGTPDEHWSITDIPKVKWFDHNNRFYLYIPANLEAGRQKSTFVVYVNVPEGDEDDDGRFNPVKEREASWTAPPYVSTEPRREVTLTSAGGRNYRLEVNNDLIGARLLDARDVNRTIIIERRYRLPDGQQQDNSERRREWQELRITGVNNGVATLEALLDPLAEYDPRPQQTNAWMISAFTKAANANDSSGRLGEPGGFCMHGGRMWCFKGTWLFGSDIGSDFLSFKYSKELTSAITVPCPGATILWIRASGGSLLLGTPTGIFRVTSGNTMQRVISTATAMYDDVSTYGSADIPPITLPDGLLFISNNKRSVCRVQVVDRVAVVSPVVPQLSDILGDATITGGDIQYLPQRIIWLFLSDSRMVTLLMTRDEPELRVSGEHDLGGGDSGVNDYGAIRILSGLVAREAEREVLVLHVRRFKQGEPVHSLEYLDLGSYSDKELSTTDYLDSKIGFTYEEQIIDMREADMLRVIVDGGQDPGEGYPLLPESLRDYVNEYGELKLYFMQVPGYAPAGYPEPLVDVMYDPLNLQFQYFDNTSFSIMHNGVVGSEDQAPLERRSTPKAWDFPNWYPLFETSLGISDLINVEHGDIAYAVSVILREELTEEQLRDIEQMLWHFDSLHGVLDVEDDGFWENNVFRLLWREGLLLLADSDGYVVDAQLVEDEVLILSRVHGANVFVAARNINYTLEPQNEAVLVPFKNHHEDFWDRPGESMSAFKFERTPGLEEFEGQRVQLLADKSVPKEEARYFIRKWPHDFLLPIERQDETQQTRNNKLTFYRRIKHMPISVAGGAYTAVHAPELKRGYGLWRVIYIEKTSFKTLLGMSVVQVRNNHQVTRKLTLNDDQFIEIDGKLVLPLMNEYVESQVFNVVFGHLFKYELELSSAVIADPVQGSSEGMPPVITNGLVKVRKSSSGNCAASSLPRDKLFRLNYRTAYDTESEDGELTTGTIDLPPEVSVNNAALTVYINQYSAANMAVTNIVQGIGFRRMLYA